MTGIAVVWQNEFVHRHVGFEFSVWYCARKSVLPEDLLGPDVQNVFQYPAIQSFCFGQTIKTLSTYYKQQSLLSTRNRLPYFCANSVIQYTASIFFYRVKGEISVIF